MTLDGIKEVDVDTSNSKATIVCAEQKAVTREQVVEALKAYPKYTVTSFKAISE